MLIAEVLLLPISKPHENFTMFKLANLSLLTKLVSKLFISTRKLNLILFIGGMTLVFLLAQIPYNQVVASSIPTARAIASEPQNKTIIEVIVADRSLKTFLAGLRAAKLVETLIGEGPFTVFAPSNRAFAALGTDTLKDLFELEDRDKLTKVLNYHIVSGKVASSNLKSGDLETLAGSPVKIKVSSSTVMVNNAKVIRADIQAKNGIIHVIDKVNLPPDL